MRAWVARWWWAVLWVVLMVVVSLGCAAPMPEVKKTTVNKEPAQVFACAQESLVAMGYTPEDGNKDFGFIRGSKSIEDPEPLSNRRLSDVITVTVVKNDKGSTIQVTAETRQEIPTGYNIFVKQYQPGGNQNTHTTESAKADAGKIQSVCGGAPVSPSSPSPAKSEGEEGDEGEDE